MFRLFSFMPPIGSYALALMAVAGTYYVQDGMLAADPEANVNQVWLVGGILAFLLAFGGFQKSLEAQAEKKQPSVQSMDVLAKLNVKVSEVPEPEPEMAPTPDQWLDADTPLARLRARSASGEQI